MKNAKKDSDFLGKLSTLKEIVKVIVEMLLDEWLGQPELTQTGRSTGEVSFTINIGGAFYTCRAWQSKNKMKRPKGFFSQKKTWHYFETTIPINNCETIYFIHGDFFSPAEIIAHAINAINRNHLDLISLEQINVTNLKPSVNKE